jgi:hypothetical protein
MFTLTRQALTMIGTLAAHQKQPRHMQLRWGAPCTWWRAHCLEIPSTAEPWLKEPLLISTLPLPFVADTWGLPCSKRSCVAVRSCSWLWTMLQQCRNQGLRKSSREEAFVKLRCRRSRLYGTGVRCRLGVRLATSQNSGGHHCFICRTSAPENQFMHVPVACCDARQTSTSGHQCPCELLLLSSSKPGSCLYPRHSRQLLHVSSVTWRKPSHASCTMCKDSARQVHMPASVRIFYPLVPFKSTFII